MAQVKIQADLLNELRNSKLHTWSSMVTDSDIESVWDAISAFVEKNLLANKAVCLSGLGTFSLISRKMLVGPQNQYVWIKRPVFLISEKFAQLHGLDYTKYQTPGEIPVLQLNYTAIAYETPFTRDIVERCVKEVLLALDRSIYNSRNVEFVFRGVGRLIIRNGRVKMKFYRYFVNEVDSSGRAVDMMQGPDDLVDSEKEGNKGLVCAFRLPQDESGRGKNEMDTAVQCCQAKQCPELLRNPMSCVDRCNDIGYVQGVPFSKESAKHFMLH